MRAKGFGGGVGTLCTHKVTVTVVACLRPVQGWACWNSIIDGVDDLQIPPFKCYWLLIFAKG